MYGKILKKCNNQDMVLLDLKFYV